MKNSLILLFIVSVLSCYQADAQTVKGKIMVGAASSFSMLGTGSDLFNFGYTTSKEKSDENDSDNDPDHMTNINLQPKIGYFLSNNIAIGLGINLIYSKAEFNYTSFNSESTSSLFSIGPFARYYIPMGNLSPFAEVNSSFGSYSDKYKTIGETDESKSGIVSFGGVLGMAFSLGEKANFDVGLGYTSLTIKEKEDNPDNEREIMGTIGIMLGFTLLLGKN